ncbi:MAG: hypothetical protein K0S08_1322 [Gammaproteobacteria bacterium]|jgi:hypothetical protein|nr:hypothetical protein [Gammaproteobacteria bacterium]
MVGTTQANNEKELELLTTLKEAITREQRGNRIEANLSQWIREYEAFLSVQVGSITPSPRSIGFLDEGTISFYLGSETLAREIKEFLERHNCTVETKGLPETAIKLTGVPGINLKEIIKKVCAEATGFSHLSASPKTSDQWLRKLRQMLQTRSEADSPKVIIAKALQTFGHYSLKVHSNVQYADRFLIDCKQADIAKVICAELKKRGCTAQLKTKGQYANTSVVVTGIPGLDLEQIFKATRSESPTSVSSQASKQSQGTLASGNSLTKSTDEVPVAPLKNTAVQQVEAVTPIQQPKTPSLDPRRPGSPVSRGSAVSAGSESAKAGSGAQSQKAGGIFAGAENKDDVLKAIKKYIKGNRLDQEIDKQFNVLGFTINAKSKSTGVNEILKIIDSSKLSVNEKFKQVKKIVDDKDKEQGNGLTDKIDGPISRGVGLAGFFKPTRARDVANFYHTVESAIRFWELASVSASPRLSR